MPEVTPTSFWRAAVRPRMLALALLLAAAAVVCGLLGSWQLSRAEMRGVQAAESAQTDRWGAAPAAIDELLAPQERFSAELVGRRAEVVGTYGDGELLVADRVRGADAAAPGEAGYIVLTPLHVSRPAGDAVLAVARGWVADPDAVPEAPTGPVTVTGHLQAGEAAGRGRGADGEPLPAGQTDAISMAQLVNEWGGPIYTGYLVLVDQVPPAEASVALLDPPRLGGGSGMHWQNLAYAVQWWLFGAFAALIWIRMVRDESRGIRRGGSTVPAPQGGEPGTSY